jgi:nucleoside-diphosphate kinase
MVIKPDGMDKKQEILEYYKKAGLKVVAEKELQINREQAEKHYEATDKQVLGMGNKTIEASRKTNNFEKMKEIFGTSEAREIGMQLREWLIKFITSEPVVAYVLEGDGAVSLTRRVTGFTDPAQAEKGTVRGDLGTDSIPKANIEGRPVRNLVHASGDVEEANKEISIWFPEL